MPGCECAGAADVVKGAAAAHDVAVVEAGAEEGGGTDKTRINADRHGQKRRVGG
ncbi:MAG: hypothetical protein HYV26_11750 [Candidatus Hydrogenedentes bacterium]|nr:hypothetical protein [Candidatus Hydrogenedentota bacterium]